MIGMIGGRCACCLTQATTGGCPICTSIVYCGSCDFNACAVHAPDALSKHIENQHPIGGKDVAGQGLG